MHFCTNEKSSCIEKMKERAVIILIHSFRTHVVGLNQIAIVFNVKYDSYVNIWNYDRIAQYYENLDDSSSSDEEIIIIIRNNYA